MTFTAVGIASCTIRLCSASSSSSMSLMLDESLLSSYIWRAGAKCQMAPSTAPRMTGAPPSPVPGDSSAGECGRGGLASSTVTDDDKSSVSWLWSGRWQRRCCGSGQTRRGLERRKAAAAAAAAAGSPTGTARS